MDSEIIRLARMKVHWNSMRSVVYRFVKKNEIKKYYWFNKKGYSLEDSLRIMYHITEGKKGKDPFHCEAMLRAAHADLSDGIPTTLSADILGIEKPEFRVAGKYHNGAPLPFGHHPRLRMYPFIRRPISDREEVRQLYEAKLRGEDLPRPSPEALPGRWTLD